jgi:hypothetical protein
MFLLYHPEKCNTSRTMFHWCYSDMHTRSCSDMLYHHIYVASGVLTGVGACSVLWPCVTPQLATRCKPPVRAAVLVPTCARRGPDKKLRLSLASYSFEHIQLRSPGPRTMSGRAADRWDGNEEKLPNLPPRTVNTSSQATFSRKHKNRKELRVAWLASQLWWPTQRARGKQRGAEQNGVYMKHMPVLGLGEVTPFSSHRCQPTASLWQK